jgi:hypothetical protein
MDQAARFHRARPASLSFEVHMHLQIEDVAGQMGGDVVVVDDHDEAQLSGSGHGRSFRSWIEGLRSTAWNDASPFISRLANEPPTGSACRRGP